MDFVNKVKDDIKRLALPLAQTKGKVSRFFYSKVCVKANSLYSRVVVSRLPKKVRNSVLMTNGQVNRGHTDPGQYEWGSAKDNNFSLFTLEFGIDLKQRT